MVGTTNVHNRGQILRGIISLPTGRVRKWRTVYADLESYGAIGMPALEGVQDHFYSMRYRGVTAGCRGRGAKSCSLDQVFQQQVPIRERLTNCRRRVLAKGLPAHKYWEAGGGTPCSHELPDTPCRLSLTWPRNRLESLWARARWRPSSKFPCLSYGRS